MSRVLSIVIPLHNEEANVRPLVERIYSIHSMLTGYTLELILVDDGSTDETVEEVKGLMEYKKELILVKLSKNYGHQSALEVGIINSNGDIVITMDGDLQHPPEYIPDMIQAYEKGAEIVQMRRVNALQDVKSILSFLFYKCYNWFSSTTIIANAADFRLMTKEVAEKIIKLRIKGKYLRILLPAMGFRQVHLNYFQEKRHAGKPSYTFYSSLLLGFNMFFKFTKTPILALMTLALSFIVTGFIYLIYISLEHILAQMPVSMIQILFGFILMLSGGILLGLSSISSYLYFILEQLRQDPDYTVEYILKANNANTFQCR